MVLKRSDLIKAAPLGLLAACGGGATLLSGRAGQSLLHPLECGKPHWKADEQHDFSRSGGTGESTIYRREGSNCDWTKMGGVKMDFAINKGGAFTRQNLTFWSGNDSLTITMDQMEALFGPGSILQLFKRWYWKTHDDLLGGTLFDSASSAVLATSSWDKDVTKQTVTIWQPGSSSSSGSSGYAQYEADWGQTWGSGSSGSDRRRGVSRTRPGITQDCALAIADYFGVCIGWVIAAAGSLAGPVEWIGFAAVTFSLFYAAENELNQCNK
jgi:hypothetical protein